MEDSRALVGDPEALSAKLQEDGYLYLKDIIPKDKIASARARVAKTIQEMVNGQTPDGLSKDAGMLGRTKLAQAFVGSSSWHDDEAVAGALECPELFDVFRQLFKEKPLTFDFKWVRGMPPGGGTGFHMDNIYSEIKYVPSLLRLT